MYNLFINIYDLMRLQEREMRKKGHRMMIDEGMRSAVMCDVRTRGERRGDENR